MHREDTAGVSDAGRQGQDLRSSDRGQPRPDQERVQPEEHAEVIPVDLEVATKQALGDKSSLPLVYGRTAFYDSDRSLTGKTGPHLQSQDQTRTETGPDSEQLVVSNKKNVGGWNVFWMLNEGTRSTTHFRNS